MSCHGVSLYLKWDHNGRGDIPKMSPMFYGKIHQKKSGIFMDMDDMDV